jgi:hypothetical protein
MSATMPFGKYKGWPLADLPDDYLKWVCEVADRDPLQSAAAAEAARRKGPRPDFRVVEDLIACGQRSLAKSAHPDTGGSHDAMLAVRAAADWLYTQARELRCLP